MNIHHMTHLNPSSYCDISFPTHDESESVLHVFMTESKLQTLFFNLHFWVYLSVFVCRHTSTLMVAPETPDISSTTVDPPSSHHSPRSLPSSLPPARPGRPRPPPPTKSSPLPLVSLSNSISASCTEGFQQNTLPPPLSPTLVSSSPLLIPQNIASADPASSSPPLPAPLSSKLLPPSDFTMSSSSPQLLMPSDRLIVSSSIWQPKGFSKDQIKNIMEQTTAGVCYKCNINN